jgi:hypothetical protein
MQELINKLMTEVGLSQEQASKSLHAIVTHVKGILPPAFGDNIDKMLGGSMPAAASAEPAKEAGLMDKVGGMADDAKEKMGDLADAAKEKFAALTSDENIENLKNKAEDLKDKAEDMAEDAINKIKGFFGDKKSD